MPRFTTTIPARGSHGNIFAIMGTACRFMREVGIPAADVAAFANRVMAAKDYSSAVAVVREWFPVDLEDDDDA